MGVFPKKGVLTLTGGNSMAMLKRGGRVFMDSQFRPNQEDYS